MIDDDDFLHVKPKRSKKCSGCKNKPRDHNFYLTEWEFTTGASTDSILYCEECIIKEFPNIKQVNDESTRN